MQRQLLRPQLFHFPPDVSVTVDLTLIMNEIAFYRSQLGHPEENSDTFRMLNPKNQGRVCKFFLTTAAQVTNLFPSNERIDKFSNEFSMLIPAPCGPTKSVHINNSSVYSMPMYIYRIYSAFMHDINLQREHSKF